MATAVDVLTMLRPNGGWVIYGNEFEGIQWFECEALTKAEFEAGFNQYDAWKAEKDAAEQAAKNVVEAKLAALGFTLDDLKLLLS